MVVSYIITLGFLGLPFVEDHTRWYDSNTLDHDTAQSHYHAHEESPVFHDHVNNYHGHFSLPDIGLGLVQCNGTGHMCAIGAC